MTIRHNGGGESYNADDEERVVVDTRPCYVRYSLRGLGVFAGGLCLIFGILNLVFHILNIGCILFSIMLICIGFFVVTNEAAGGTARICHCIFIKRFPSVSDWMDNQPPWIKPMLYIIFPIIPMVLCTTVYTFFGGGFVIASGVAYAISISPSRQSSAAGPQNSNSGYNNNFTTNTNVSGSRPNQNVDNRPSTSDPTTPTIIDIRNHKKNLNNPPTTQPTSFTNKNPLTNTNTSYGNSLGPSSTTSQSHNSNFRQDFGQVDNGDHRYANISVISEQSNSMRNNSHSNNGIGSGGAYPDSNPFEVVWEGGKDVNIHRNRNDNQDEHNC